MKIILIGANGTVGKNVARALKAAKHEVIAVGKTSGEYQVDIENPASITELYARLRPFDAVVNASGDVAFAPLAKITLENWNTSLKSKLLGQINLVQLGLPYINDRGSFTLVSGIVGKEQIAAGAIAATINGALEGFVKAAACELPRGIRINVVSPAVLEDSLGIYGDFFPGFKSVNGQNVGFAFKKPILGIQSGQVIEAN